MRVALIQPPMGSDYPPLSLGYLAAYLASKGHTPRVFDLQIAAQQRTWKKELAEFAPGLVGLTAMTPGIVAANQIAASCKEILPKVPLVLGGYHVSFLPEATMARYRVYDIGVLGEGELTLHELADTLDGGGDLDKVPGLILRHGEAGIRLGEAAHVARPAGAESRHGDELFVTPPRERITDIDSLPWPHEQYDFDWYLWYGGYTGRWTFKCASAIVSRGCPFRCRFCASRRFWSSRTLFGSPERVAEEMAWLARRGARSVYFRDSTFTANRKWVREFCEAKRRLRLKTRWICNSRVDTLNEEIVATMRESGLEAMYFGVESGSQRVLDHYNKGTTVEQTRQAFALCHKYGVATAAYFMIGAPIETRADIEASRQLARDLGAKYTYWFIYTPLPGSEMYDEFLGLGYSPDFERYVFNRASIPVGDIQPQELEALHHGLVAEFQRKVSRGDVWHRRLDVLRSVRSWGDVCHLGRKLFGRLGLMKGEDA